MLEITGDDIAALNDADLRTLVGLLCEAELRKRGFTTSAATWGGNQDAKDGGVDVRVRLGPNAAIRGFVPRPETGFQVKKPDLRPTGITKEMRPSDAVRPAIAELAQASGAYIIVSSAAALSDAALERRRTAMSDAVSDLPQASNLALDFYDRNRVATWVRDHAGVIPWIRSRIGKAIPGWRSYGSWSNVPSGVDLAYLADDHARISAGSREGQEMSAADGINRIRDVLRSPGGVVRLVGLSGVGKTRLVEALFDRGIGSNSLDPSLALYADSAEGPDPTPVVLAANLNAASQRAILVVDNCPPEVHRKMSEVARAASTTISVITVEYDIREDQPEGTDVFALSTASESLVERLVAKRFPQLSEVDARTAAEFSGGNARIALALAGTVAKNETLAGLSDEDLFQRLFHQRHERDASLLSIAQACSLVYSFEGEDASSDQSELAVLADAIGKTSSALFGGVAELKRRDLLQARGPWRAVLPAAIANRLAATALQNIPKAILDERLVRNGPPRLLQSFSRRLGYLDGSNEARAIVAGWLGNGGMLNGVADLNQLGRAMFVNVAPVAPYEALRALEAAVAGADEEGLPKCLPFVRLLRSLAYDTALFERAVAVLVELAGLARANDKDNDAAAALESLFYIVLSGTHAPLPVRLNVVAGLLRSTEASKRTLGARALKALLKTTGLSSHYDFDFGARSRDYGSHPRSVEIARAWFRDALKLAEQFALSESAASEEVRTVIAEAFRGVWVESGCVDELERLARAIGADSFWREGWIAARLTRVYDGRGLSAESAARLASLEAWLRPKDLTERVRGLVVGSRSGHLDLDDVDGLDTGDYSAAAARAERAVEDLGHDVAKDEVAFSALLPELVAPSANGNGKVVTFGIGLASGAEEPRRTWSTMVAQVAATQNANIALLCGFLNGLQRRDRQLANALADEAVLDDTLGEWLPVLQAYIVFDGQAVSRLLRSLEHGKAPIVSDPFSWTPSERGIGWPRWRSTRDGGRGGASPKTTRPGRSGWSWMRARRSRRQRAIWG